MSETWRPISGWEDRFEVSDHGRVRSIPRVAQVACRWGGGRTLQVEGRILTLKATDKGYLQAQLQYGLHGARTHRTVRVHRLVLNAFVGPCPDGMECRHLDGDPTNNFFSNLRWGTSLENASDQKAHGTAVCGERVATAKLTNDLVKRIRVLASNGARPSVIASEIGVTDGTVRDVLRRRTWRHVQ